MGLGLGLVSIGAAIVWNVAVVVRACAFPSTEETSYGVSIEWCSS